ncbi:hypothetical protein QJQ45_024985 [Haematococcus lacustris]|nr:hypothetical protein QJQ45_024985 [Haematococcus lacustris]
MRDRKAVDYNAVRVGSNTPAWFKVRVKPIGLQLAACARTNWGHDTQGSKHGAALASDAGSDGERGPRDRRPVEPVKLSKVLGASKDSKDSKALDSGKAARGPEPAQGPVPQVGAKSGKPQRDKRNEADAEAATKRRNKSAPLPQPELEQQQPGPAPDGKKRRSTGNADVPPQQLDEPAAGRGKRQRNGNITGDVAPCKVTHGSKQSGNADGGTTNAERAQKQVPPASTETAAAAPKARSKSSAANGNHQAAQPAPVQPANKPSTSGSHIVVPSATTRSVRSLEQVAREQQAMAAPKVAQPTKGTGHVAVPCTQDVHQEAQTAQAAKATGAAAPSAAQPATSNGSQRPLAMAQAQPSSVPQAGQKNATTATAAPQPALPKKISGPDSSRLLHSHPAGSGAQGPPVPQAQGLQVLAAPADGALTQCVRDELAALLAPLPAVAQADAGAYATLQVMSTPLASILSVSLSISHYSSKPKFADVCALTASLEPVQDTQGSSEVLPAAAAGAQAQYIQLQGLYQQLKVQKISDLEGLLEEQEAYVEAMSDAASKLVAHWKEEAERQLALSQAAGAVETLDRLAQLEVGEIENLALKRAHVDQELVTVELKRQLTQLQSHLHALQPLPEQASVMAAANRPPAAPSNLPVPSLPARGVAATTTAATSTAAGPRTEAGRAAAEVAALPGTPGALAVAAPAPAAAAMAAAAAAMAAAPGSPVLPVAPSHAIVPVPAATVLPDSTRARATSSVHLNAAPRQDPVPAPAPAAPAPAASKGAPITVATAIPASGTAADKAAPAPGGAPSSADAAKDYVTGSLDEAKAARGQGLEESTCRGPSLAPFKAAAAQAVSASDADGPAAAAAAAHSSAHNLQLVQGQSVACEAGAAAGKAQGQQPDAAEASAPFAALPVQPDAPAPTPAAAVQLAAAAGQAEAAAIHLAQGSDTAAPPAATSRPVPSKATKADLRRTVGMQCPTPLPPSPGVACQFPSPAPQLGWLSGAALPDKMAAAEVPAVVQAAGRAAAAAAAPSSTSPLDTSICAQLPTPGPGDPQGPCTEVAAGRLPGSLFQSGLVTPAHLASAASVRGPTRRQSAAPGMYRAAGQVEEAGSVAQQRRRASVAHAAAGSNKTPGLTLLLPLGERAEEQAGSAASVEPAGRKALGSPVEGLCTVQGTTPDAGPAAAEGHTQASQQYVEADSVGDWLPTSAEVQAEAEEPGQPGQALKAQAGSSVNTAAPAPAQAQTAPAALTASRSQGRGAGPAAPAPSRLGLPGVPEEEEMVVDLDPRSARKPARPSAIPGSAGRQSKRRAGPVAEPGIGPGKQLQMRSSKVGAGQERVHAAPGAWRMRSEWDEDQEEEEEEAAAAGEGAPAAQQQQQQNGRGACVTEFTSAAVQGQDPGEEGATPFGHVLTASTPSLVLHGKASVAPATTGFPPAPSALPSQLPACPPLQPLALEAATLTSEQHSREVQGSNQVPTQATQLRGCQAGTAQGPGPDPALMAHQAATLDPTAHPEPSPHQLQWLDEFAACEVPEAGSGTSLAAAAGVPPSIPPSGLTGLGQLGGSKARQQHPGLSQHQVLLQVMQSQPEAAPLPDSQQPQPQASPQLSIQGSTSCCEPHTARQAVPPSPSALPLPLGLGPITQLPPPVLQNLHLNQPASQVAPDKALQPLQGLARLPLAQPASSPSRLAGHQEEQGSCELQTEDVAPSPRPSPKPGKTGQWEATAGEVRGVTTPRGDRLQPGQTKQVPAPSKTPSLTPRMARLQHGVLNLFGFEVRCLAEDGAFEYRHPGSGLRFQEVRGVNGTASLHYTLFYLKRFAKAAHRVVMQMRNVARPAVRDAPATGSPEPDVGDSELMEYLQPGAALVEYVPVVLGNAPLPKYLQEVIQFEESQKQAFMKQLWQAVGPAR